MSTVEFADQPDFTDGVMLCVRPNNPERFVVQGGTPVDDIHCTLLFFGNIGEFDGNAAAQATEVLGSEVAPNKAPISGEITAVTTFELAGDDDPPLVLLVDAPGLSLLRADCLRHLSPALSVDTQPKLNHDFMPHITMCYGPDNTDMEFAKSLIGEKIEFTFLEFVHGTEISRFNLGEDGNSDVIPTHEVAAELLSVEEMAIPQPDHQEEPDTVPYEVIENDPDCDASTPYGVHNTDTGECEGCSASKDEANALIADLTANEDEPENAAPEPGMVCAEDEVETLVVDPSELASAEIVTLSVDNASTYEAMPVHHTATTDSRSFDGDEAKIRTRSDESPAYYDAIYAWHDGTQPPGNKTSYRFPHHMVSATGDPGAAVTWAVHAAILLIDESTIPEKDYEGVYRHLSAHLEDAGVKVPKLGADNASIEEVHAAFTEARKIAFDALYGQKESAKFDISEMDDVKILGELTRRWVESVGRKGGSEAEFAPAAPAPATPAVPPAPAGPPEDTTKPVAPIAPDASGKYEWEAVMIVEGLPSGDGRMIAEGALTWRDLPLPLMLQTANAEGHSGAVIAGSILEIERQGQNIVGRGNFDTGPAGQQAKHLAASGTMRGCSADIDSVQVTLQDTDGNDVSMEDVLFGDVKPVECLTAGRIMGLTQCAFPAFMEAHIDVTSDTADVPALAASGSAPEGELWVFSSPYEMSISGVHEPIDIQALVASAAVAQEIPVQPPTAWFALQDMDKAMPFTVYPDGRIFGLVAQFGTCHIGFRNRCVDVPRSMSNYRYFRNKNTLTAEGDLIATGPIFMNTVHPSLRLKASDAEAHYADTGCAVADVALYENEFGIVAAGAVRPSATPEQIRTLRGSDISPDWRSMKSPNGPKSLELVGLLAVNVSGFPVALAASAGEFDGQVETLTARAQINLVTDEVEALVAAGSVRECKSCGHGPGNGAGNSDMMVAIAEKFAILETKLAEVTEAIRPYRVERLEARLRSLAGATLSDQGS